MSDRAAVGHVVALVVADARQEKTRGLAGWSHDDVDGRGEGHMTEGRRSGQPAPSGIVAENDEWLVQVGVSAAAASGTPVDLLGEFLPMLAEAAIHGRRPEARELDAVRELGQRAAKQGVGAGQIVGLYLSAAWRLWRELPMVVRSRDREKVRDAAEAVLRVLDDAVAVLVESHQSARRDLIRHEEALRREFVDDLLRGDADISRMVERAEPFGLDLGKPHHVALAVPREGDAGIDRAATFLERVIVDQFGDRDVLVATKDGRLVVLVPATSSSTSAPAVHVGRVIRKELSRVRGTGEWRVATGRSFPGAYGVARSYEEAREALLLADRLHLDADVVDGRDLLVYRVVGRDQAAIVDLVRDVLGPLLNIRGGPEALLNTLQQYFNAGEVATETAKQLHVSVRTVTYRLAKITNLTGYNPAQPQQRFALHAAVLGARLLDWPRLPLPSST
jgi:sugar diacid utilization regulator